MLLTADDVLADLAGEELEIVRAGRVERVVTGADEHGGQVEQTAYDCLVRLRRP